jgi:ubiquinone/menaquinone biosynthesis C-methylase UbiE
MAQDQWAAWLGERRHAGDPEVLRRHLEVLAPIRDRVIANAAVAEGQAVLDVGCGDGLIAFAVADAVGPGGRVIFSDVSADLLARCRDLAAEAGVLERCEFARGPASDLAAVADGVVDVVTMRSVLIYEAAKRDAFAEFFRVLRPGGRLSLFEPINRFGFPEAADRFLGYDVAPVAALATKVKLVYQAIQPPTDPMLDFDERDLVTFAEAAGFTEIHAQVSIDIGPLNPQPWPTLLNSSGNPRIPTLGEAMREALTDAETDQLSAHLRPLVEQGTGRRRSASTYLCAARPS